MPIPTTQRFHRANLPHARCASQLVLLSSPTASASAIASASTDTSHPTGAGPVSAQLRLSAHPCAARTPRHPLQSQDGLSTPQTPSLAGFASASHPASRTTPRGQGGRASIQPALGLRHYHLQALVRSKTPAGGHHRLCRPHGYRLEITGTADGAGCLRTPPRSPVPTLRPANSPSQRAGVPHRQRTGVYLGSAPAVVNPPGSDCLSHPLPQPAIQRLGRVVLRQFQTRLSFTPAFGIFGRRLEAHPDLDYPLQRSRAPQRAGHVGPIHFLSTVVDRITNKNYINTCPVLTGSHQFLCQEKFAATDQFTALEICKSLSHLEERPILDHNNLF